MKIRTSKPKDNSKYYNNAKKNGDSWCITGKPTDRDCNVLSNCVGYACGRFNEIIGSMKYPELCCNAENFIERAKLLKLNISNVPTLGGIMVWQKGATLNGKDGAGHVAIVERIDSDNQIYTSESSYNSLAFYNAIRKNDNGRWGMNANYKFIGCIVNPAVKDESEYKTGTYKCNFDMYVRYGAGTNYGVKLVKDLSEDGKKNATSKNMNAYAVYKKGTRFTAIKIINNSRGNWAKTPSGYVCIKGSSGRVYCTKC